MNRNVLKIIALISMIIDHVGIHLLDNNPYFRIIGRIAFPIFAFFIAEGLRYTRSKKRYVLSLSLFAIISQIPYIFLYDEFKLNILFTFLIAIAFISLINLLKLESVKSNIFKFCSIIISLIVLTIGCFIAGDVFRIIEYHSFGILLILCFYYLKSYWKFIVASIVMLLMVLENCLLFGFELSNLRQLFSLVSILMLIFYNQKKGKFNLKYLFYIAYPAHLFIIYFVTLII